MHTLSKGGRLGVILKLYMEKRLRTEFIGAFYDEFWRRLLRNLPSTMDLLGDAVCHHDLDPHIG